VSAGDRQAEEEEVGAKYDPGRRMAEVHPQLAFTGAEKEKQDEVKRWLEWEWREEETSGEKKDRAA
jgi:hypothetical protein